MSSVALEINLAGVTYSQEGPTLLDGMSEIVSASVGLVILNTVKTTMITTSGSKIGLEWMHLIN